MRGGPPGGNPWLPVYTGELQSAGLGLDVAVAEVDTLFDEWDRDGGGVLDFKELDKILRQKPAAAEDQLSA